MGKHAKADYGWRFLTGKRQTRSLASIDAATAIERPKTVDLH
jgi:hypothetical protein